MQRLLPAVARAEPVHTTPLLGHAHTRSSVVAAGIGHGYGEKLTDSESATRVTSDDDMIAKGSCILGQKCSRGDSDKKGRTGRTEYLYK